jgi:CubicO group peptidase (beta-lactamase class C family)
MSRSCRIIVFAAWTLASLPFAVVASANTFDDIEAYVADYQKMGAFDGVVLVAQGNEVVWKKAFGFADYSHSQPMSTDTRFRIASLSKQVTQAAIGRLIDDGKLRLQSRLSDYLPDFPNARRITIKHLLDHTAGIAHTNRLDWMDMSVPMSLDEIVASLATEELLFTPGIDTQYSNGGYALLAKVIEVASGSSYAEFIAGRIAKGAYPSIGDEAALEAVPDMAARYAPGPVYGERVAAETYITANRIGGGSLYGNAEDIFRFFRDSYDGKVVSPETTAVLFKTPDGGDIQITGRSPGALAQVYLNFDDGLTVVTLSSNSAWPGSFNSDIVSLYRGEDAALIPFQLAETTSQDELQSFSGTFGMKQFGWIVNIESYAGNLVFVQGAVRTAFARTTDNQFHLPLYDWLCRYSAYNTEFVCRQRDPDADIRFLFERQ